MIHRPYLRVDPAAYPESTEFCSQSAHMVLKAFQTMTDTTLVWMFWTMSYRVSGWSTRGERGINDYDRPSKLVQSVPFWLCGNQGVRWPLNVS